MSKSLKPKNDNYVDSTGIVHERTLLSDKLNLIDNKIIELNKTYRNAACSPGNVFNFSLHGLENYLLSARNYGNGNVGSSHITCIITTGSDSTKISGYITLESNNSPISIEFTDAFTLKITCNNWCVLSLTRL